MQKGIAEKTYEAWVALYLHYNTVVKAENNVNVYVTAMKVGRQLLYYVLVSIQPSLEAVTDFQQHYTV